MALLEYGLSHGITAPPSRQEPIRTKPPSMRARMAIISATFKRAAHYRAPHAANGPATYCGAAYAAIL